MADVTGTGTLSSPGVGSNLDVKSIVAALVSAEITPMQNRYDKQVKSLNTEISALGQVKSYLSSLQTSLNNLSTTGSIYQLNATASDTNALGATLTTGATTGSYQIEIEKLAQKQSLASDYLNTSSVGTGTIIINFGTYSSNNTVFTANPDADQVTITIGSGNDSLVAVRDAINNSDSGVTASIVTDDGGSRLTITSSHTGEDYAMNITGTLSALHYDPVNTDEQLSETVAAQNSQVKINGLTLTQNSNELNDSITGLNLTLKKAEDGKIITLDVTQDKEQFKTLVKDFVKKYNDTMGYLNNISGYNSTTKQAGDFQGDSQLRILKFQLSQYATNPPNPTQNGTIESLADIGITLNKDGTLSTNQTKLDNAFENNYDAIGALFAKTATATDTNIRIKTLGSEIEAGSYDVSLTTFNAGTSMSGTIGGVNATSSDGITLKGTGDFRDISLTVLGGSTGSRGKIVVTDGFAVQLSSYLDNYISSSGDIVTRTNQLKDELRDMDSEQDKIDARQAAIQARYLAQYTALDSLISQLQTTGSFLTQQLANLPSYKN